MANSHSMVSKDMAMHVLNKDPEKEHLMSGFE